VQAATVMGAYQAVAGGALASAPRTTPAPNIVNPGGDLSNAAAQSNPFSGLLQPLQSLVNFYQQGASQFSGLLQNPVGTLQQIITAIVANPEAALVAYAPLLFFGAYEVISPIVTYGPMLMALSLGVSLSLGQITLPLGELAPIAAPIAAGVAGVPALAATASTVWPVAGVAPTAVATPAGAPVSVGAAAAGTAAPAPAATTGTFAYMIGFGGGPGTESGPTVGPRGGIKAPAATIPAAGAVAPSRAAARARRRRRAAMREYGDEYLDMDSDIGVAPEYDADELVSAAASGSGAGRLGFAGTTHQDATVGAAGLTKLAGDEFGGGPRIPMVPGTWDGPGESGRGGDDGS
jgi:PPE-repeat protein